MEELISVIVPVHNVESYLNKCLSSIINQTYKNLEIILIDDGSTDASSVICDEFKKKDSRIKVIHKENEGLSSARNKGLDIAKGSLISFVDSDDFLEKSMLEELKKNMKKYDSDISICNYYKVNNDNRKIHDFDKKEFAITDKEKFNHLENEYGLLTVYAWNKLYKKYLFNEIRYPHGKIFEDSFVICDLLEKASKVSYLVKPLYNYVSRSDSIIHTFTISHFDKINSYNKKIDFFKNKEYYDLMNDEQNRKVNIIICNLAKCKYFKIKDKKIKDRYYKELLISCSQIKWTNAYIKTKMFKIFRKSYINLKFLEYKIYYLKNKANV